MSTTIPTSFRTRVLTLESPRATKQSVNTAIAVTVGKTVTGARRKLGILYTLTLKKEAPKPRTLVIMSVETTDGLTDVLPRTVRTSVARTAEAPAAVRLTVLYVVPMVLPSMLKTQRMGQHIMFRKLNRISTASSTGT